MLAHDFGNGGGADAVTEITVFGRNFLERQKNFAHPTRNRQFGWGVSVNFIVQ